MNLIKGVFGSSLGKKYIMAISGMALFLFVVVHMLGNLQIFLGPEAINDTAIFCKANRSWSGRRGLAC